MLHQNTIITDNTYKGVYPGMNNLLRFMHFNEGTLINISEKSTYFLYNHNALVQLLSHMNINPNWSYDYLCVTIEACYNKWSSQLNLTSVYNRGMAHKNVVYKEGYLELLIASPKLYNSDYYLNVDESKLIPIIPIYTTDTHIDFSPYPNLPDDNNHYNKDNISIIAIDLYALGVGYWRNLNNKHPLPMTRYLAKYPLVNAKLLSNRLSIINILYTLKTNKDVELDDILKTRKTQQNILDYSHELKKYILFLDNYFKNIPIKTLDVFLTNIGILDSLNIDNRILTGGEYNLYSQSKWVWKLHIWKLHALIHSYNKDNNFRDDFVKPIMNKELLTLLNTYSLNIKDEYLKIHYEKCFHEFLQP